VPHILPLLGYLLSHGLKILPRRRLVSGSDFSRADKSSIFVITSITTLGLSRRTGATAHKMVVALAPERISPIETDFFSSLFSASSEQTQPRSAGRQKKAQRFIAGKAGVGKPEFPGDATFPRGLQSEPRVPHILLCSLGLSVVDLFFPLTTPRWAVLLIRVYSVVDPIAT